MQKLSDRLDHLERVHHRPRLVWLTLDAENDKPAAIQLAEQEQALGVTLNQKQRERILTHKPANPDPLYYGGTLFSFDLNEE